MRFFICHLLQENDWLFKYLGKLRQLKRASTCYPCSERLQSLWGMINFPLVYCIPIWKPEQARLGSAHISWVFFGQAQPGLAGLSSCKQLLICCKNNYFWNFHLHFTDHVYAKIQLNYSLGAELVSCWNSCWQPIAPVMKKTLMEFSSRLERYYVFQISAL